MAKQTILIVEDDLKVVELINAAVRKMESEYTVKIAYNGQEALDIIEKDKIDLAMLDIHMPVMSGAQLLTELCNRKIWFPIIIITAYNVNNIHNYLMEYGIIDLLVKPLDIVNLKERIEKVLKKSEHKDSISGLSLATIMQILEMEKQTGVITIKTANRDGRIFFKDGVVVDIEAGEVSGIEALMDIMDPAIENKEFSIEYQDHQRKEKIHQPFTQVLLETSRLLDERKKKNGNNQEHPIDAAIDKQFLPTDIEIQTDIKQLTDLVDDLKEKLGEALLSTAIWTLPDGRMVAGFNWQEEACTVFTQITLFAHEALTKAKYPGPGNYFIFDLKDDKKSITIFLNDYSWGILIDSKKAPMEFFLKETLPKQIAAFQEVTKKISL